ncbi:catalase [Parahaliea mediterranea]|uniref:catalase n=1 Tax=Parahaliea mediterranea TaxID=651086 RepID=UPI000E2EB34A|nr:catalase [Parahaliea mediterranea]
MSQWLCCIGAVLLVLLATGCSPRFDTLAPGAEKVSGEEARIAAAMIAAIEDISLQRNPSGLMHRFNQVKTLGCVKGTFTVLDDVPAPLAQGLFADAGARYPATLRYANATRFDDREKDFRGLSIKLSGIAGSPLWGEAGTQDFLLNSHPVLFAGTPGDFLSFIEATRDNAVWRYFLNPAHWYSLPVVLAGRSAPDDPFALRYYSTTPYRLGGEGSAVKYSVQACPGSGPGIVVPRGEDFLGAAMAARLAQEPLCLAFMVQPQGDPAVMPVENAAVAWDETASPFVPVARIVLAAQDVGTHQRDCEAMRFNPWQALPEHRPLGGINRVRIAVYAALAEFRQAQNQRRGEP